MQSVDQAQDTEPEEAPAGSAPRRHAVSVDLLVRRAGARSSCRAEGSLTIGRARGTPAGPLFDDSSSSPASTCESRAPHAATRFEDLGSTNGTFLDGPRLERPTQLSASGALVLFGNQVGGLPAGLRRRSWRRCEQDARRRRSGRSRRFSPALASTLRAAAASWPAPTPSSCWSARRASARRSARAPSTGPPGGRAGSWRSTARRCRRRWSRASCSAIAPAPTRPPPGQAGPGRGGRRRDAAARRDRRDGRRAAGEDLPLPAGPQLQPARRDQARAGSTSGSSRRPRARRSAGPGALRADLVARLGAEPIAIPPLRKRPEEILALVAHFGGAGRSREIEPAAFRAPCASTAGRSTCASWRRPSSTPLALTSGGRSAARAPAGGVRGALQRGAPHRVRRRESAGRARPHELEQLLQQHDGNVASVARALDRKWNVVWRWVVKYKLRPEKFRG